MKVESLYQELRNMVICGQGNYDIVVPISEVEALPVRDYKVETEKEGKGKVILNIDWSYNV